MPEGDFRTRIVGVPENTTVIFGSGLEKRLSFGSDYWNMGLTILLPRSDFFFSSVAPRTPGKGETSDESGG